MTDEIFLNDGHCSETGLLLYSDGELSAADHDRVSRHLLACWSCRATSARIEQTIRQFAAFLSNTLGPFLSELSLLSPRLPLIPDETAKRWWDLDFLQNRYRASLIALAVLLLAASAWKVTLPATVSASELIDRASLAEALRETKVRGRKTHREFEVAQRETATGKTRRFAFGVWRGEIDTRVTVSQADEPAAKRFESLLSGNSLDWREPFSIRAFSRWRGSLRAESDRVVSVSASSPIERIEIVNRTEDQRPNSIVKASIDLRREDLVAVEEHVWTTFSEITIRQIHQDVVEDSLSLAAKGKSAPAVNKSNAEFDKSNERDFDTVLKDPDPEATEMAVRLALHHLGADLGEPITIGRNSSGEVLIEAIGVEGGRREQIEQLHHRFPYVLLDFTGSQAASANLACKDCGSSRQAYVVTARPDSELYRKLIRELGSRSALEALTKRILEASELSLAHADALRSLALRYSQRAEHDLEATPRTQLQEMLMSHAASLRSSHQALLAILPEGLSSSPHPLLPASLPSTWQDSTILVRKRVAGLDQILKQILTSYGSSAGDVDGETDLFSTLPSIAPLLASYLTEIQRNL